jgi:ankyrin repeat protein
LLDSTVQLRLLAILVEILHHRGVITMSSHTLIILITYVMVIFHFPQVNQTQIRKGIVMQIELSESLTELAYQGDINSIAKLLKQGINPDIPDHNGETALIAASSKGYLAIIKLLINYGADINYAPDNGWSALAAAIVRKQEDIVDLLLEAGATLTPSKLYIGKPPLMLAAMYGHEKIVQSLLRKGAPLDRIDSEGNTALIEAANGNEDNLTGGNFQIVKLFLDHGADVNTRTKNGWSALMCATSNGDQDIVRLLIEAGANVGIQAENGWTPLMLAASHGQDGIVNLLLSKGATPSARNNKGQTASDIALSYGFPALAHLITRTEVDR